MKKNNQDKKPVFLVDRRYPDQGKYLLKEVEQNL